MAKVASISCRPVGLGTLDDLEVDTLVLLPFVEERPLTSTAGWCDWRLNGRLSRLLAGGWFAARPRELLLLDGNGRIGAARILVQGLGSRAALDLVSLRRALDHLLGVLERGGWREFALELPGVEPGPLLAVEALRVLCELLAARRPGWRLVLLCPHQRLSEFAAQVIDDFPEIHLEPDPGVGPAGASAPAPAPAR